MAQVLKMDQKILDKYLNGASVKTALQTPLKELRGYVTSDERAIFICTPRQKNKVSQLVTGIATAKSWNLSIHTEGSHLVCLLYP